MLLEHRQATKEGATPEPLEGAVEGVAKTYVPDILVDTCREDVLAETFLPSISSRIARTIAYLLFPKHALQVAMLGFFGTVWNIGFVATLVGGIWIGVWYVGPTPFPWTVMILGSGYYS